MTCTGVTARWCPVHGDCSCRSHDEALADDMIDVPILSDPDCALHAPTSAHGAAA